MSKLNVIKNALESNPDVVIIQTAEESYLSQEYSPHRRLYDHHFEFFVVPKQGLFVASELQAFMCGLVPGLEPSEGLDFLVGGVKKDRLLLGYLGFEEEFGEERVRIERVQTITDEELLKERSYAADFISGKKVGYTEETFKYKRRILIEPFPNEALARRIIGLGDNNNFLPNWHSIPLYRGLHLAKNIPLKELRKYQPKQGLLQRLFR